MEKAELKSSQANLTSGEDEELPSRPFSDGSSADEHGMPGVPEVFLLDPPPVLTVLWLQADDLHSTNFLQCAIDLEVAAVTFISGLESERDVDGNDVTENKISFPEVHETYK